MQTTTATRIAPPWGLTTAHPDTAAAVWGARLIAQRVRLPYGPRGTQADVARLPDRQGFAGEEAAVARLNDWLKSPAVAEVWNGRLKSNDRPKRFKKEKTTVLGAAQRYVEVALLTYVMDPANSELLTLYEDHAGVIVGNTNGSYGYCYIAAWLKGAAAAEKGA